MSTKPPFPDPVDPVFPPASPPMSPLVYRTPVEPPGELPVLSNRAIVWAAVVLIVLGVGLVAGLLVAFGDGQNAAQLDAIKTAGTIVLGTGGAAALWLTARRQRTSELNLNQARATHAANVADAEARRITDLYGKGADQLGSAQAPVRLAGLYALERLAQDNLVMRQAIVELLCAYLRMPYEPPRREPARRAARPSGVSRPLLGSAARRRASVRLAQPEPRATTAVGMATEAEQEYQVRRTAQDILFRHLRVGDEEKPVDTFWSGISLDLTGALLGPANLIGSRLVAANFTGATFTGDLWFDRARFGLGAVFTGVWFAGEASFSGARFDYDARFDGVTFHSDAQFDNADFSGRAKFDHADFRSIATFTGTTFAKKEASFYAVRFADQAVFAQARFAQRGVFVDAHFAGDVDFSGAEFVKAAGFSRARFAGTNTQFSGATLASADFHAAEFGPNTDFTETQFIGDASFNMTTFTGSVGFTRAKFDSVNLGGTRFATFAAFDNTEFGGETRFYKCYFGRLTMFERARFAADVLFEMTQFAQGAGFTEAKFGGRAQFIGTSIDGVGGFRHARFDGEILFDDMRFGGPVAFADAKFAKPPRIKTVWVRLDGRKLNVDSTWPPNTAVRETSESPCGVDEGRWGLLDEDSIFPAG